MLRNDTAECNADISVFGHLAMRQTEFEEHPFFEYLATDPSPDWLQVFIPKLGFWAHAFQDALTLVEQRVTDPTMRSIAEHIREGDIGHDEWFCSDLKSLGLSVPSLVAAFDSSFQTARLASYSLMSEIYRANDDRLLIVYLLALESASYVFFETMTEYLERIAFPISFKYFGRNHLDAELNHGIVEAEMDIKVETAVEQSSPEVRHEAHALIDRIFMAFTAMFDSFVPDSVQPSPHDAPSPPPRRARRVTAEPSFILGHAADAAATH